MASTRDVIIRRLTPFIRGGAKLSRQEAFEVLAGLSPDERSALMKVLACARLVRARKQTAERRALTASPPYAMVSSHNKSRRLTNDTTT